MEVIGATGTLIGLAIPVFECAKALRDRIKLVRYPHNSLRTLGALIIILYPCSQVASEKAELLTALAEYEKDIDLLESLYNGNKELLDQHTLDTDLKALAEYAWTCLSFANGSDNVQNHTRPRRMAELDQSDPGEEENAGAQGIVEIRRSTREIGRIK